MHETMSPPEVRMRSATRSFAHGQCSQIICAVKSYSRALATFQNIVKAQKQVEAV